MDRADFRYVKGFTGPPAGGPGRHLLNTQVQCLLGEAWVDYLLTVCGGARDVQTRVWPTVREVVVRFESE